MRALSRVERGFTLVELIASITIVTILAAVALPRVTAANPFQARGYADTLAANLRKARAVAFATGCDVQFTIDADGFRAMQRAAAGNHCAAAGTFVTPILDGIEPPDVTLAADQQFVFSGATGGLAAPVTIDLGTQTLVLDPSGVLR